MPRTLLVLPVVLLLSGAVLACTTETIRVVPADPAAGVEPGEEAVAGDEPGPVEEASAPDGGKSASSGSSGGSGSTSSSGGASGTSGGSSSGTSGTSGTSGGSSSGTSGTSGGSSGTSGTSGGSSGTSGGIPAFTGVGATTIACQGRGSVNIPGVTMKSGFAARMAGQMNVFLYSRPEISTLAYGGTTGEYKLRLVIGNPTSTPNQYQGQTGVFRWSDANKKWETYAGGLADIVLVDIVDYTLVDPAGLTCNGKLRGVAQWLSGATAYTIAFEVPILTPTFPGATAGPP